MDDTLKKPYHEMENTYELEKADDFGGKWVPKYKMGGSGGDKGDAGTAGGGAK